MLYLSDDLGFLIFECKKHSSLSSPKVNNFCNSLKKDSVRGLRIFPTCQKQASTYNILFFLFLFMSEDGKQNCGSHPTPSTVHVNTTAAISELCIKRERFAKCLGAYMPVGVEGILLGNFDPVIDRMQQILLTEVELSQLSENLLVKWLLRINVCVCVCERVSRRIIITALVRCSFQSFSLCQLFCRF